VKNTKGVNVSAIKIKFLEVVLKIKDNCGNNTEVAISHSS
jgi:hypothetical protein